VQASHAKRYQELGDWIRACYDTPLAFRIGQIDAGKRGEQNRSIMDTRGMSYS
jgi:hypothetical protein